VQQPEPEGLVVGYVKAVPVTEAIAIARAVGKGNQTTVASPVIEHLQHLSGQRIGSIRTVEELE
jgi:hypothetical protein